MPKRLTALGFAFRRFAVPGRVGARVFGLNIGCRYSTPVRKRPLHPTRSQFKPEASQTQAPVSPSTEPERRAGGSLTTIMYVAAVDPLNAHWAAPVLAPTQPLDKASIPPSTAPSRLPCHPIKSAVPSPHFGVHQHPAFPPILLPSARSVLSPNRNIDSSLCGTAMHNPATADANALNCLAKPLRVLPPLQFVRRAAGNGRPEENAPTMRPRHAPAPRSGQAPTARPETILRGRKPATNKQT